VRGAAEHVEDETCRPAARTQAGEATMKLKLYMKKINQEMIRVGSATLAGCDLYVSWTKSCCILDFGKLRRREEEVQQPGFLMRKEGVGGLLWSPRTGAVYQADEEAYHAILDLEAGLREDVVASKIGVSTGKVRSLSQQLARLKLL
jgi:hypothetical protein